MTERPISKIVLCGDVCIPDLPASTDIMHLSYFDTPNMKANVKVGFIKFIDNIELLPANIVDLLEIAAYVFSADRSIDRGRRNSVNNESWARSFEFYIPVRDLDFWTSSKAASILSEALTFMTGDRKYEFHFSPYKASLLLTPIINFQYLKMKPSF